MTYIDKAPTKTEPTDEGVFDLTELTQNVSVDYGKIKGLLEQGKTPTLRVRFEGVVLDLKVLTTGEICIEPDTINRKNWSLTEDRVNALQNFQAALGTGQSVLPLRSIFHIISNLSFESNLGEEPSPRFTFKVGDEDNPQGSLIAALCILNDQMTDGGNWRDSYGPMLKTPTRGGVLEELSYNSSKPQITLILDPEDSGITKDL